MNKPPDSLRSVMGCSVFRGDRSLSSFLNDLFQNECEAAVGGDLAESVSPCMLSQSVGYFARMFNTPLRCRGDAEMASFLPPTTKRKHNSKNCQFQRSVVVTTNGQFHDTVW